MSHALLKPSRRLAYPFRRCALIHKGKLRLRRQKDRRKIPKVIWIAGWQNGAVIMRIRLRGINSYTAKLADGTIRKYWYAWKGGPRLQGEPGTPEFIASYNEAAAQKIRTPAGCGQRMTKRHSSNLRQPICICRWCSHCG